MSPVLVIISMILRIWVICGGARFKFVELFCDCMRTMCNGWYYRFPRWVENNPIYAEGCMAYSVGYCAHQKYPADETWYSVCPECGSASC